MADLQDVEHRFEPIPCPRRLDLMIAAIASVAGLPLYTDDFAGLESMLTVVGV